jgi:hypothetical protein
MSGTIPSRIFDFPFVVWEYKYESAQNYACCIVLVWNFVSITEEHKVECVREYGAEEDI